jgi:dolichol-phosphate mannosyltransferase
MVQVSVVLPTFNEAGNIGPLVKDILTRIPEEGEVIVVDDDSPDKTWQVVEKIMEGEPRVRLIRRIGRRGLTSALNEGIEASRGGIIFWMDCDFSQPPEKIPELLASLQAEDVVLGSRYVPGGEELGHSSLGSFLSRLICFFSSRMLDPTVKDYTSGFIGTRRDVLKAIPLRGDYGEYCIDFLYRALKKGYRVREIPYRCVPRRSGESKTATDFWGYVKRGKKYLTTVLRLRFSGKTGF